MNIIRIFLFSSALSIAFFLTGCAYHSPGAKVSNVINVSIVPAQTPTL